MVRIEFLLQNGSGLKPLSIGIIQNFLDLQVESVVRQVHQGIRADGMPQPKFASKVGSDKGSKWVEESSLRSGAYRGLSQAVGRAFDSVRAFRGFGLRMAACENRKTLDGRWDTNDTRDAANVADLVRGSVYFMSFR